MQKITSVSASAPNIDISQSRCGPHASVASVDYMEGSETYEESPTKSPPDTSPDQTINHGAGPTTKAQLLWSRVQFSTLCWTLFVAGWNDGSTGPLLPRIQAVYHVNYTIVSLIFVFACIGFVGGAILNVTYSPRFGFGKMLAFGSICQLIGFILQTTAPPFPAFVLGYVINGIGLSIQDAQANGFVASLKRSPATKMGVVHAAYGAGALCAPLVATQFSQLKRWSFHYLVSLCIAIINGVLVVAIFRFRDQDGCLSEIGQEPDEMELTKDSQMRQIVSLKAVHLLALYLLFYVGVEVTIGGWIVTYVINVRNGGPSSGYMSAGFFGGLTLGRVILLWVNKKVFLTVIWAYILSTPVEVGEYRVVFIYGFLAIGLEIIVWLVPSLVGGGVAVSLIGLLLGPMYPIAMNQAGKVLPNRILTSAIGWMAGFGQAGSAALPFITGAISQRHGIQSLHPFLVAMMGTMLFLWALTGSNIARPRVDSKETVEK